MRSFGSDPRGALGRYPRTGDGRLVSFTERSPAFRANRAISLGHGSARLHTDILQQELSGASERFVGRVEIIDRLVAVTHAQKDGLYELLLVPVVLGRIADPGNGGLNPAPSNSYPCWISNPHGRVTW